MVQFKCELGDIFTEVTITSVWEEFSPLLQLGLSRDSITLESCKFYAKEDIKLTDVTSFEIMVEKQIGILDFLMARELSKLSKNPDAITFKKNNNRASYNFTKTDYAIALSYAYYMLLTRNKIKLADNEEAPSFCKKVILKNLNAESVTKILGDNNHDMLVHKWIVECDLNKISKPILNRIKGGIAGTRYFNIFNKYKFKSNLKQSIFFVAEMVREIAKNGPFWEQHPINHTANSVSMSKNLKGLLLETFDEETINQMVEDRTIYKKPNNNEVSYDWKNWESGHFDFMKTPIFNHNGEIADNNNSGNNHSNDKNDEDSESDQAGEINEKSKDNQKKSRLINPSERLKK